MGVNAKSFPLESRDFRMAISLVLGFGGQVPLWLVGIAAGAISYAIVNRVHFIAYIPLAPLAPGAYLADAMYSGGHGDMLLILLAYMLNGIIYTTVIFTTLTLWCRRRTRRSIPTPTPRVE